MKSKAGGLLSWAADGALIGGAAAIAYGAWLIYAPAGFIVGGVLLIGLGLMIERAS